MSQNTVIPDTWNLSELNIDEVTFSPEEYYVPLQAENAAFVEKWRNDSSYLTDPSTLLVALTELEGIEAKYDTSGNAGYYFELRSTQEQDSPVIKGILNNIHDISIKMANDRQFFLINLSKVTPEVQRKLLNSPQLSKYQHFLEILFRDAKYILSEKEEKIFNLTATSSYGNWVQMTSDLISREERLITDETGTAQLLPIASIINLTINPNKKVRDAAAAAYNEVLQKHVDIAEVEINNIVQYKRVSDETRGFSRPDASVILSDDLDVDTVDTLLEAVSSRYDISREYYKLKAKLLGYDRLAYHERNVTYGNINQHKYTYSESVHIVQEVFQKLDSEFLDIYKDYLDNGRFDVFPRKGKMYGAFCSQGHLRQPGFILLNHTDLLTDVTTIAHEMGHAINHELMRKNLSAFYFDSPLATAEVASTFMEDFVLDHLEQSSNEETRLAILMKRLDEDVSAIMRQVACYKFEQELHAAIAKEGYLAKDQIGKIFQKHMGAYMGEGVSMDPGSENWWVYWSHIRMFFYVYSYASGLLISKSLQRKYKENREFINQIKEFLTAGTSDSPYNIFKKLGLNIKEKTFWLSGLTQVEENLKAAHELAAKLKLI